MGKPVTGKSPRYRHIRRPRRRTDPSRPKTPPLQPTPCQGEAGLGYRGVMPSPGNLRLRITVLAETGSDRSARPPRRPAPLGRMRGKDRPAVGGEALSLPT